MKNGHTTRQKAPAGRYALLDELRGLDLVSMMLYHACWDMMFLFGIWMDWYAGMPGRTGVRGRGACHGSHAAFYAGGQSYFWCADPAGQRYAADRPFGKATAAHSTRSRVCHLRSVVCPYPQCLGRLSGFWQSAPLAAAGTLCKLRYSVLWLLSVVVLFYGLFCPSAVAVSVLGRVLSLRHCRAAAHGALAPLGLPGAGLDGPALAFAVSAAPAGDLRRTFSRGSSFCIKGLTQPGSCGILSVVRRC